MTGAGPAVWIDGEIVERDQAKVSLFDRGVLFAQAAYEVTAVVDGRLIDLDAHMRRLDRTLVALDIPVTRTFGDWQAIHESVIAANSMREGVVYLQVSGGAYGGRDFVGPATFTPMAFLFTTARPLWGPAQREGVRAVTCPDERWARRDLKTTQLLSQTRAYRAALAAGAQTAVMLAPDATVTEAASANAWMVTPEGEVVTRPLGPEILPGVTRRAVLNLAERQGYAVAERVFTRAEAAGASELFLTSTGAGVVGVTHLDGDPIGGGAVGPVTRALQAAYADRIGLPMDL